MVNKFLHPNGGAETYVFQLGRQLEQMGHKVEYFGMEHPDRIVGNRAGMYTDTMDFHAGGWRRLFYPFRIIYSREAAGKIRKVLEHFEPDVVHLNNFNFQLTPSILYAVRRYEKEKRREIRIIYTAHDYQWVCPNHMLWIPDSGEICTRCTRESPLNCARYRCIHNSGIRSILGAVEGWLYRRLRTYEMVDQILCPSYFMERMLSRQPLLADKTIVLHNFMNREEGQARPDKRMPVPKEEKKAPNTVADTGTEGKYCADTFPGTEIEEKYCADTMADTGTERKYCADAPAAVQTEGPHPSGYILYFGRYAQEKGIASLLEVCRRLPEVPFVFAGRGPLEQEVDRVSNIRNLGFLEGRELENIIKGARFVVFPSEWYENCPFSVMEAQSCGVPVLASDLGGTGELIRSGKTGELFRGGDAEALEEGIRRLWEDPERCRRYAEGCRSLAYHSLETYADRLVEIYRNIQRKGTEEK